MVWWMNRVSWGIIGVQVETDWGCRLSNPGWLMMSLDIYTNKYMGESTTQKWARIREPTDPEVCRSWYRTIPFSIDSWCCSLFSPLDMAMFDETGGYPGAGSTVTVLSSRYRVFPTWWYGCVWRWGRPRNIPTWENENEPLDFKLRYFLTKLYLVDSSVPLYGNFSHCRMDISASCGVNIPVGYYRGHRRRTGIAGDGGQSLSCPGCLMWLRFIAGI